MAGTLREDAVRDEGGEVLSFNDYTYPVGRKPHRCEHCKGQIATGEKHAHFVGEWQGDFQNWRMHLDCKAAWREDTEDGEICPNRHERGKNCRECEPYPPENRPKPPSTMESLSFIHRE